MEECIQKEQERQRIEEEAKDARNAAAPRAERENADSKSQDEHIAVGSKTAIHTVAGHEAIEGEANEEHTIMKGAVNRTQVVERAGHSCLLQPSSSIGSAAVAFSACDPWSC